MNADGIITIEPISLLKSNVLERSLSFSILTPTIKCQIQQTHKSNKTTKERITHVQCHKVLVNFVNIITIISSSMIHENTNRKYSFNVKLKQ